MEVHCWFADSPFLFCLLPRFPLCSSCKLSSQWDSPWWYGVEYEAQLLDLFPVSPCKAGGISPRLLSFWNLQHKVRWSPCSGLGTCFPQASAQRLCGQLTDWKAQRWENDLCPGSTLSTREKLFPSLCPPPNPSPNQPWDHFENSNF